MRAWIARKWAQFKRWIYGILVSIGLISGAVMAQSVDFTWTMPTERVDGTALDISELVETRIYCDQDPVPKKVTPSPATSATVMLGFGSHDCTATVVDIYSLESAQSNQVTKVISPTSPPKEPVLNQ